MTKLTQANTARTEVIDTDTAIDVIELPKEAQEILSAADNALAETMDTAHKTARANGNTAAAIALTMLQRIEADEAVAALGVNEPVAIKLHDGAAKTAKRGAVAPAVLDRETINAFWQGDTQGKASTMLIEAIISLSPACRADAAEIATHKETVKQHSGSTVILNIQKAAAAQSRLDEIAATRSGMRDPVQRALNLLGALLKDGHKAESLAVTANGGLVQRVKDTTKTGKAVERKVAITNAQVTTARQAAKEAAGNKVKRQPRQETETTDANKASRNPENRNEYGAIADNFTKATQHLAAQETPAGVAERRKAVAAIAAAAALLADLDTTELQGILDNDADAMAAIIKRSA